MPAANGPHLGLYIRTYDAELMLKHIMDASAEFRRKFLRASSTSNKASTAIINSTLVGGDA
jgi:hypothetical protein